MSRRHSPLASTFANLTLASQGWGRFFRKSRRSSAARASVVGRRLTLESLEHRHLLSVGPQVVGTDPGPEVIDVTFNEPIDPATFDAQDVALVNLDDPEIACLGFRGGTCCA